jgi:glyoxylase I family protein
MSLEFIDHLVFVVKDIAETERFYSVFLGTPKYLEKEHVIYTIGETMLFFVLPKGTWEPGNKDKGGFNHIAFGVRTIDELQACEQQLIAGGINNSGVKIDPHGGKEYIWLDDPNGLRLEFYLRQAG